MLRHLLNLIFFLLGNFQNFEIVVKAEYSLGIRSIHLAQYTFKETVLSCQLRQEICSQNFSI